MGKIVCMKFASKATNETSEGDDDGKENERNEDGIAMKNPWAKGKILKRNSIKDENVTLLKTSL